MTAVAKVADHGGDVKGRGVLGDGQGIAVVVEQEPASGAGGPGQPRGAGVEHPDAVNETIGRDMGMAADDDVGAASRQQRPQLLIGDVGTDARAVVGPG